MRGKISVRMKEWLKEPLLHFSLFAAVIFFTDYILRAGAQLTLEIPQSRIDARVALIESATGSASSQSELIELTDSFIDEQILVREAVALNLDRDARIEELLAQKMRHVLSGGVIQPNDQEIEDFYVQNIDKYITPPHIDADEVIFDAVTDLPTDVYELLDAGANSASLLTAYIGSANTLSRVNPSQLANLFDREFSDTVFQAEEDSWIGPFISDLGQHWLKVINTQAARTPPLEEIEFRVRLDWIAQEEETRLDEAIKLLRSKYNVQIVGE